MIPPEVEQVLIGSMLGDGGVYIPEEHKEQMRERHREYMRIWRGHRKLLNKREEFKVGE